MAEKIAGTNLDENNNIHAGAIALRENPPITEGKAHSVDPRAENAVHFEIVRYIDGVDHAYAVDGTGKRHHIKHDELLRAYGYQPPRPGDDYGDMVPPTPDEPPTPTTHTPSLNEIITLNSESVEYGDKLAEFRQARERLASLKARRGVFGMVRGGTFQEALENYRALMGELCDISLDGVVGRERSGMVHMFALQEMRELQQAEAMRLSGPLHRFANWMKQGNRFKRYLKNALVFGGLITPVAVFTGLAAGAIGISGIALGAVKGAAAGSLAGTLRSKLNASRKQIEGFSSDYAELNNSITRVNDQDWMLDKAMQGIDAKTRERRKKSRNSVLGGMAIGGAVGGVAGGTIAYLWDRFMPDNLFGNNGGSGRSGNGNEITGNGSGRAAGEGASTAMTPDQFRVATVLEMRTARGSTPWDRAVDFFGSKREAYNWLEESVKKAGATWGNTNNGALTRQSFMRLSNGSVDTNSVWNALTAANPVLRG